jgi:hypothetical protein
LIPVVQPLEELVCQFDLVDSRTLKEVNGVLHLRCKLVPQLDGKVHIGGAKGSNESIFECLDCPFSGVNMVIARFDELEVALLWGKVQLDCFCCLIVHDTDFWGVPFAHKKFKVLFVCVKDTLRI